MAFKPFATGREVSQPDGPILRVGGDIRTPGKLQNTDPVYPKVALDGGVAGVVVIEVTIGADGSVTDARIVRSVPLLDEAALDAVKQWKYERTIKDGVAIPVRMTVTVNFSVRK